jgi:peptide/nickel transport system substrate-binding protein/oligopeptide transport system substrate-binding protein
MQVRRRAAWLVLPVALSVGLMTACGGGGEEGGGNVNPEGVVQVGIAEPQYLTPGNTNETSGSQVLAALFAPLVDYDSNNKPVPVVADSITTSDNIVWTIKIKDGYTFHNGEKLTSDAYINAWNYAAYGPNGQQNNYFFDRIKGYAEINPSDPDGDGPEKAPTPSTQTLSGLAKVDDLTFTATLAAPFSEFSTMLGYTAFYPLPAAAFSEPGVLKKDYQEAPIGNGPFTMKGTWQHDDKIEVTRYGAYPGTKPKIGGAIFKVYQQPTAEYADLLANNTDVMKQIPTENLSSAPTDLGDRYVHSPASTLQLLAFPTFLKEFENVNVRKAISMALNRDEQITAIFKNSQATAKAFVSPVVAGYRADTCGEACNFDAAKAKEMYTAAGGPSKITITYNADGGHKDWVDASCNQIKASLGVECVGAPEAKFADMLTKLDNKKITGMFRMGWVMDYPSMENYLGPLYSTTGSSNFYGYSNPQFDNLVKEGQQAPSPEAAIAKYQQAEDLLAADLPVLPMRFGQNNFGYSTRVQNVTMDLFNRVDLMQIESLSSD